MMTGVQFPSRAYGEEFDGKGKTHFDDFYVSRLSVVGIPDFQQKKKRQCKCSINYKRT